MDVSTARRALGPVGVFVTGAGAAFGGIRPDQERAFAALLDGLGYGSLWLGEGIGGKNVFLRHAVSLAATSRLVLGTGIANIMARHPRTMHASAATLAEAYPDRFVLGIGAGLAFQAAALGGRYRPLRQMREYLDGMDAPVGPGFAEIASPSVRYPRVLAAIGPRMLALAAERADGAYPFAQPVEQTVRTRAALGPDKLVVVHQGVVLNADRAAGFAAAEAAFARLREMPAYAANYRRLGYPDEDLDGPSRRIVDAVFAVGDEDAIAHRVREQLDAGADHVLVSPVTATLDGLRVDLARLAPALTDVRVGGVAG